MKLAVIGFGNMAQAIVRGLIDKGVCACSDITASDKSEKAMYAAKNDFMVNTAADNASCIKGADLILLSTKPVHFASVAEEIAGKVRKDQTVLSIMAGQSLEVLSDALGEETAIVRAMPNMPALVGQGITGYCENENVTGEALEMAEAVLSGFGEAVHVSEAMMPAVTSVGGSAPAFVFMFIEALADGAVAEGMPRAQAMKFAAKTVMGSAAAVMETGKHPGELKDMVSSPAGTTIEGVAVLEEGAFRSTVIEAVRAAAEKSRGM